MRRFLASSVLLIGILGFMMINSDAAFAQTYQGDDAFGAVVDDPALPRVLLIGDSISIGYTAPVRDALMGVVNVHRIPENGGPTSRGIEKIEQWLGDPKTKEGQWDVIHFNWGLHDIKYMEDGKHQVTLGDYRRNMKKLVKRMQKTGAKLIWCDTTPVPQGDLKPLRVPGDEILFNQAAKTIMERENILANDLYTFALVRLDEIQQAANVHFTKDGSKQLGERVAAVIQKALAQ